MGNRVEKGEAGSLGGSRVLECVRWTSSKFARLYKDLIKGLQGSYKGCEKCSKSFKRSVSFFRARVQGRRVSDVGFQRKMNMNLEFRVQGLP